MLICPVPAVTGGYHAGMPEGHEEVDGRKDPQLVCIWKSGLQPSVALLGKTTCFRLAEIFGSLHRACDAERCECNVRL